MFKQQNKRIFALDVIRSLAVLFIILGHFLYNIGNFYKDQVDNFIWLIPFLIRSLTFTGVPLFLLLSGYLLNQKKLSKEFYHKLWYIIGIYIIASIITAIGNVFILNEPFKFWKFFNKVIEFNYLLYAWYVEMYIGLFLMVPFLNILWNALPDKKQKEYLIATFSFLGVACTICRNPQILPDFWISIYPIAFYFIGAWFAEYKLKWSYKKSLNLLLGSILFFGCLNFVMCYTHNFHKLNSLADQTGIEALIISVLIFNFFLNLDYTSLNIKLKKCISFIAKYSYGLFLCSYITDRVVYTYFNQLLPDTIEAKLPYYLGVTAIIFAISLILSTITEFIYSFFKSLYKRQKKTNS